MSKYGLKDIEKPTSATKLEHCACCANETQLFPYWLQTRLCLYCGQLWMDSEESAATASIGTARPPGSLRPWDQGATQENVWHPGCKATNADWEAAFKTWLMKARKAAA